MILTIHEYDIASFKNESTAIIVYNIGKNSLYGLSLYTKKTLSGKSNKKIAVPFINVIKLQTLELNVHNVVMYVCVI